MAEPAHSGQGLPRFLAMVLNEMICATNLAWGMYPGFSHGAADAPFYRAKLDTARFYYQRLLPRTRTHKQAIEAGAETLMAISVEDLGLGLEI